MKHFILLTFLIITFNAKAQKYLCENWVKVNLQLAAKKSANPNLYVELSDYDPINKVYHTINLHDKNLKKQRDWVIVSTSFDNDGLCYSEIYSDFKSTKLAFATAKIILSHFTLIYANTTNDVNGYWDNYMLYKNNELDTNLVLKIGYTNELPEDKMIAIVNNTLFKEYIK